MSEIGFCSNIFTKDGQILTKKNVYTLSIDKIYVGIVKRPFFCKLTRELMPLIDGSISWEWMDRI